MSDVRLIKFVGGEEIVATVVNKDTDSITVTDAVVLVYQQSEKGVTVGFAPFMPYAKGKIQIVNSSVASYTEDIEDKFLAEYNRVFSKIVIASANAIQI